MSNLHTLPTDGVEEEFTMNGHTYWRPALPLPFFTTKGLPIWKRFNENNWRPQCDCGEIFDSMDKYKEHFYREAGEA